MIQKSFEERVSTKLSDLVNGEIQKNFVHFEKGF